jgi:hypothetical protein
MNIDGRKNSGPGARRNITMADSYTKNFEVSTDFSLILGGPLFQLFRRFRLGDDATGLVHRRIIVITLFAWLPLLLLSLWEGLAMGGKVNVPFLVDVEAHARFLVALPLLIYSELIVNERMRPVIKGFLDRKLVPEDSMDKLDAAVKSAFRLRNSLAAEILLLALVYVVGIFIHQQVTLKTATWYSLRDGKLSLAGMWYVYISLPVFQFILLRWYYRLFIWARFLWQVSRIRLNLIPTHPDHAGGLGFLATTVYAFAPILMAHGILLSGLIADRIFHLGAKLPEFNLDIFSMAVVLLIMVLGPLLVFTPQLNRAKRTGLAEYGTLAMGYVREFDNKWLRRGGPAEESFIGSADIQSLADLDNSFEVIREMRLVPFTRDAVLQLAVLFVLPVLPLLLTMFSAEELLQRFLGTVF